MDAIVELDTAEFGLSAPPVVVVTNVNTFVEPSTLTTQVFNSAIAPSQGTHSISAVAPDLNLRKVLAKA